MPRNCPWTLRRGPSSSRGVDELLPEPNARPVCALRVNFFPIGTPSTNGVGCWIDVREFEQADQCKRIFGKAFGDRAVSSVRTTDPCASRTSGVDVKRSLKIATGTSQNRSFHVRRRLSRSGPGIWVSKQELMPHLSRIRHPATRARDRRLDYGRDRGAHKDPRQCTMEQIARRTRASNNEDGPKAITSS